MKDSLLLKFVSSQIDLLIRVPLVGEHHKEKLLLLKKVMTNVLEVSMKKILPGEKLKSLM